MMNHNYHFMKKFLKEYLSSKSPERKIFLVKEYEGKYSWDPI